MITLDGMPGAGKSTLLNQLLRSAPERTRIFPEAQPCDCRGDNLVVEHLLQQACDRITTARQLARSIPDLLTASDRCHIGVLAYRFALMRTGRGPAAEFDYALTRCHELDLMVPKDDLQLIVLLVEPAESVARRAEYAHDPRHRLWFDIPFLTAYHQFLLSIKTWITSPPQPALIQVGPAFGWRQLTAALPREVAVQVTSRIDERPPGANMKALATTSRRLLTSLAAPPTDDLDTEIVGRLAVATHEIRTVLAAAEHQGDARIDAETMHRWRTSLDRLLAEFESTLPAEWTQARQPGTWLDSHLRLRSLLAHEVGKAYWEERTHINYVDIDVERYLWGAR